MRYILYGIVFAVLAGFIPHYSYSRNEIFGFILGLFFAEIISLRKRMTNLEQTPLLLNQAQEVEAPHYDPTPNYHQGEPEREVTETFVEQSKTEQAEPFKETETLIEPDTITVKKNSLTSHIKIFFTTGNVVLKLGIIIIFFGVSFLLKYAAQRNLFPIEFRFICVVIAALAMLVTGWSMRCKETRCKESRNNLNNDAQNDVGNGKKRASVHRQYGSREYGLVLQGGGIGILYITVFAASKLYSLLPGTFSMIMMIMLVALAGALAVMQDAKSLAVSGIIGGFLAPVLMSTGSGSHVMLFSYYALLNCGILGIAWFKAWRELNLVGFAFTFVISALWGSEHYAPELFSTTEPFLILFFLFYVAISVLFAHRQPPKLKGFIDGPLVFGLPIVGFSMQSALVSDMEYGLAITALTLGFFYIILATILWNRLVEGMRMLTEAFIAMGVVFGTLAIPLALDGRWTSTAWALEGAAMVWVGIRQNRLPARLFGILLELGAGIAFLAASDYPHDYYASHYLNGSGYSSGIASNTMLFLNHIYLGCIFISIAGLFSSYYMVNNKEKLRRWEKYFHIPLLVWGLLWWFSAGLNEIDHHFSGHAEYHAFLIYCALSCQLMSMAAKRFDWKQMTRSMMWFLPVVVFTITLELIDLSGGSHLFAEWGGVAWVIVFAVQYGLLWQFDHHLSNEAPQTPEAPQRPDENVQSPGETPQYGKHEKKSFRLSTRLIPWWHIITLWLLVFVISHETVWAARQFFNPATIHSLDLLFDQSSTWSGVLWGVVPALFILLLLLKGELLKWPVVKHHGHYLNHGVTIPAFFLMMWILWTNFYAGNPEPLPYFPLVNPLELSQVFVLIVLSLWAFRNAVLKKSEPALMKPALNHNSLLNRRVFVLLLIFVWLNFVTGRAIHFYFNVQFEFDALAGSVVFQAAISILWGTIALFTTAFAARTGRRKMWFAGAVLLGLLVLKLFTVDLSGIRTIARIVSFLAVGGLMLLIGYLSPLPPILPNEQKEQ